MKQPPKNKSIFNKEFKEGDKRPTTQYLQSLDVGGDGNTSIGDIGLEAGISLIGGKLAGKALSKIGGRNIKSIGGKVSKFFNSYINPSSGKKIAKEATSIVAKKRATLKAGGVIPKGEFGYGKSQNFANTNAKKSTVPKETEYTSIDKGPTNRKGYFEN
tara:strand:+ start:89 stop:565 length:477 start_codon:yes stop_codon:yes gene_type:complete